MVVAAPHDEGGETRREVDAVHGADGLAARVDDRPEGPEERPAVLGARERRVRLPHLGDVPGADALVAERLADHVAAGRARTAGR